MLTDPALPDSRPWSKAAYPVWALVSGFPGEKRRKRPLVMLKAYIDDSGTGGSLAVMAGFAATAERWAAFSDAWPAALAAGKPIENLKMSEAFGLAGQFRNFTEDERDKKLRDLLSVINEHAMSGVALMIDTKAYAAVMKGGAAATLDHPYFHACMMMILHFLNQYRYRSGLEKMDFIFDRMNPKIGLEVIAMWLMWKMDREPGQPPFPQILRDLMGTNPIVDGDEKILLPLQAAELLAGSIHRTRQDELAGVPVEKCPSTFVFDLKMPVKLLNPSEVPISALPNFFPPGYREDKKDRTKRLELFQETLSLMEKAEKEQEEIKSLLEEMNELMAWVKE
jgi:hypothetical protein